MLFTKIYKDRRDFKQIKQEIKTKKLAG